MKLPQRLVWLAFLAGASGLAALIYEVTWFHLLQVVIGSSAFSLGILVATYMGGLCLGSVLGPAVLKSKPLHVYAVLELVIAILAILILNAMPFADVFYQRTGGSVAVRVVGAVI